MDDARAREALRDERARVERLLQELTRAGEEDRDATRATGDMADPAQPLTDEQTADAIAQGLRDRLAAIERAEARLEAGTYGRSVLSGKLIPEQRLAADPAAELTIDEAIAAER